MRKRIAKKIMKSVALQITPALYHKYQVFNAYKRIGKKMWYEILSLAVISERNQIDNKWDWREHDSKMD